MGDPSKSSGERDQIAKVSSFLDEKAAALDTVLRQGIDVNQFIAVAKTAITSNPKLLQCLPGTVYSALRDAAHLGLTVDPRAGEFWLIPRWNRNLGANECTGMIGYKGFIGMAKRAGVVTHIETRVVYEDEVSNDLVHIDLANGTIRHPYSWTGIDRADDKIVGAYCAAWLPTVDRLAIEPLTIDELRKRMKSAQTTMVWDGWFVEMCRKTACRALFGRGYFPLSAEVSRPKEIGDGVSVSTLGHALEVDDKYAAIRDPRPVAVEVTGPAPGESTDASADAQPVAEDPPPKAEVFLAEPVKVSREEQLAKLTAAMALEMGQEQEVTTLWVESQVIEVFGGRPWTKLKAGEKDAVLEALSCGWDIQDLGCADVEALKKRLDDVRRGKEMNMVDVVSIAESNSIPYDGTNYDSLSEGDLRRLISKVREK